MALFFVILGPRSVAFFEDGKHHHQINIINNDLSNEIAVEDNEHNVLFPSTEKL